MEERESAKNTGEKRPVDVRKNRWNAAELAYGDIGWSSGAKGRDAPPGRTKAAD
jgi:hypothetical protein